MKKNLMKYTISPSIMMYSLIIILASLAIDVAADFLIYSFEVHRNDGDNCK
jgi:hypothetical protein